MRARRPQGPRGRQAVPSAARRGCACSSTSTSRARTARSTAQTLQDARRAMGERLAAESPGRRRLVIGLPDSGTPAAIGFAGACGHPVTPRGWSRTATSGARFIQPDQALREHGVRLKFNPLRAVHRGQAAGGGRRLDRARHDDAPDRGDAARRGRARGAPARSRRPPIVSPCFYGIDMADQDELIAAGRTLEEIRAAARARLARLPLAGGPAARDRAPGRALLPRLLDRRVPDPVPDDVRLPSSASSARPRRTSAWRRRAAVLRATPGSTSTPRDAVVERDRGAPSPRRARRACSAVSAASRASSRPAMRDPCSWPAPTASARSSCWRSEPAGCDGSGSRPRRDVRQRRAHLPARGPLFFLDYLAVRPARPRARRRARRGRRRRAAARPAARCSAARRPSCPG